MKNFLISCGTSICFVEIHHIIPRSMGGNDSSDNLVNLTAEELYGKDRANQIKEKQRHVGNANGFFGKQHSTEQREKKRQEKLAAPKKICYYCSKEVDSTNYGRWHGDNCKFKK